MHGHKDDGHADKEVDGELVSKQHKRHDCGEDGGDGRAVLFEDGVCKLEEKAGQDALHTQRKAPQQPELPCTSETLLCSHMFCQVRMLSDACRR